MKPKSSCIQQKQAKSSLKMKNDDHSFGRLLERLNIKSEAAAKENCIADQTTRSLALCSARGVVKINISNNIVIML